MYKRQARNTAKIGLSNELFQKGSIHYVGSEIRSIILNKMTIAPQDNICVISGESIAIEAAMLASEGNVTAVEYSSADRNTLEDNIEPVSYTHLDVYKRQHNNILITPPCVTTAMFCFPLSIHSCKTGITLSKT